MKIFIFFLPIYPIIESPIFQSPMCIGPIQSKCLCKTHFEANFNASNAQQPAMTAFVEATAGIIRFKTPWVSRKSTPNISNWFARCCAFRNAHSTCWGLSASKRTSSEKKFNLELIFMGGPSPNGFSFSHKIIFTYSTQCSGNRGVLAIVQSGKLTWKKVYEFLINNKKWRLEECKGQRCIECMEWNMELWHGHGLN